MGSVIYELTTGKAAFDADTTGDVIAAILKTDPPPPANFVPDVPYEIERIISRALRKDRETRYQTAKDMLADLQEFKKEAEFQARLKGALLPRPGKTGGSAAPARAVAARAQLDQEPLHRTASFLQRWYGPIAALLLAIVVIGYLVAKKSNGAAGSARPRTLAILPFRNLKPDPEDRFSRILTGG